MRFGSVCSGIEAASVAWHPLGWKAAWLSEIEPFPSAVLAHHYPDVPNLGDMTLLPERILSGEVEAPDVFCGGTPCQAFSVAGLRNSLDDARGNLSLTFVGIANAIDNVRSARGEQPAIVFWENVPGVLSTKDNAFGCFISGLAGEENPVEPPRGKWTNAGVVLGPQRTVAWRILDAQYFGVAQRRRRVFVVASARDDFDPASVLFEFDGVRRDTAPSRKKGKEVAPDAGASPQFGGMSPVAGTLAASTGGMTRPAGNANELDFCIPISIHPHCIGRAPEAGPQGKEYLLDGSAYCMDSRGQPQAVAQPIIGGVDYENNAHGPDDVTGPLLKGSPTGGGRPLPAIALQSMAVRRLTPVECERLQGFPDGYTNIPKKVVCDTGAGPCAKQVVTATLVATNGTHFVATNHCDTPQSNCPRAGLPTGVGYELCASVCQQPGHAEINAIKLAGKYSKGSTIYIEGHTYACESCLSAARAAGVDHVTIGAPPGTSPDGPRYKALGNSWAVPVVAWIGKRIQENLK